MSEIKDSRAAAESQPTESELDLIPPPSPEPSWRLKRGATVKAEKTKKPSAAHPWEKQPSRSTPAATPAPTSPHGTPAATLYYGTSPKKDPQDTPMPTTATTIRPATVADYRSNIERQAKEQKNAGNVLIILVYGLMGVLVLGALLAGYGTYVLSEQLRSQSVTISDLQKTFATQNQSLATQLNSTIQALSDAQGQISRQQEEIDRLLAANEETSAALRIERQARQRESQEMQLRLQHLEQR